jgi:hypothetical protein
MKDGISREATILHIVGVQVQAAHLILNSSNDHGSSVV